MFSKLARLFAKIGTSFTNPSDRRRLRTVLGVEGMEDRTVPAAIPLTGPNGGAWVKIDTLTVATKTNQTVATGVTSNAVLAAGQPYLMVASGSARIATDSTGFTDAEYIRYNKSTGPQTGQARGTPGTTTASAWRGCRAGTPPATCGAATRLTTST